MGHKMTKSNQSYLIIIFGLMPSNNIMPWTFSEILEFSNYENFANDPGYGRNVIPKSES